MKLNKIIFPAPKPTYSLDSKSFVPIPRKHIQKIVEDLSRNRREIYDGMFLIIKQKSGCPMYVLSIYGTN